MNKIVMKEIVNKKASKDAKRINKRRAYRLCRKETQFVKVNADYLVKGFASPWHDINLVEVEYKKRPMQRRGQVYWSIQRDKGLMK